MSDFINNTSHLNLQDGPYILTKANQKRVMSILPSNGPFSVGAIHTRFPTFSPTGLWGAPESDYEHNNGLTYNYYYGEGYYWGGYVRWPYYNRYPWTKLIDLAAKNGDFMTKERVTKIRDIVQNWVERPHYYHYGGPGWRYGRYGYWGGWYGWGYHWNWGEYMSQLSKAAHKSEHSPINGIEPWLLPYLIPGQFDISSSKYRSSIPGRVHWNHTEWYYYKASTLLTILYSNGDLYALKAKYGGRDDTTYQCGISMSTWPDGQGDAVSTIDGIMTHYKYWRPVLPGQPAHSRPWGMALAEHENIRPGTPYGGTNSAYGWTWPSGHPAPPGGCFGHSTCWERRFRGLIRNTYSEDCNMRLQAVWVEHYNVNDPINSHYPTGYGIATNAARYGFGSHVQNGKINDEGGAMEVPMGYAASVSIAENDLTHQWKSHGWNRWGWMYNYWDWWYGHWWSPWHWWGNSWYPTYYGYPYYYNWYYWGYWRWPWYRWHWWGYYWNYDNPNAMFQWGGHFNTGGGAGAYGWSPWWWPNRATWGIQQKFPAAYQNKLRAKMGSHKTTHHRVDFALHWNTGLVHAAESGTWYGHEDIAASGLCHPNYDLSGVSCEPFSGVDIEAVGGLFWYAMHHYKNAFTGVKGVLPAGPWGSQDVVSGRPLITTNDCALSNSFHFPTGIDGAPYFYQWPYWGWTACLTGHYFPQSGGMTSNPALGDTWFTPRPHAGQINDNQFVALKDGWDSFFEGNRTFAGHYPNLWNSIPNGGRVTGEAITTIGNADAQGNWDGTYSYKFKTFTGFSQNWETQQPWHNAMSAGKSFTWPAPQTHDLTWPGTWSPTPTEGTNQSFYQLAMPGPSGRVGPTVYSPNGQGGGYNDDQFPPYHDYAGSGLAQDWSFQPHPDHLMPVTTSGFNDFIIDFITGVCTGSQMNEPNMPATEGCRWKNNFFTGCFKNEEGCLEWSSRGYLLIDYQFPNLRGAGTAKVYVRDHYYPQWVTPTNPIPPRIGPIATFTQELVQQADDAAPLENPRGFASAGNDYCYVQQSGTRQAWIPVGPSDATQIPSTGRFCDNPMPQLRGWDQCSQYGFYVNHSKVMQKDAAYWGSYIYWIPWYYYNWIPRVETRVINTPQFDAALDTVNIIPNKIYIVEVDLEYSAKVPANESWDGSQLPVGGPPQTGMGGIEPGGHRNIWSHGYGGAYVPTTIVGPIDCAAVQGQGQQQANCVGEKTVEIKETYVYNQWMRAYAFDSCIGMYPNSNDIQPVHYGEYLPLNGYERGNNMANGYADIGATFWNLGHKYPTGFYTGLWRPQGYWRITSPDAISVVNGWTACNDAGFWRNYNIFQYPITSTTFHPCRAGYHISCAAFGTHTWRKMHPPNANTLWTYPGAPTYHPCGVGKAQTNMAEGKLEMFKMTAQQGGGFTQGAKVFEKDFAVAKPTWGNAQTKAEFFIPGDKCLCVGTGNRGFMATRGVHGNFYEDPILTYPTAGASYGYGLHEATAYAKDQWLPASAKIDNSYHHYKFKWSFDFFRMETEWAPYPYNINHIMYEPVGDLKYENEWTGLSPTRTSCTYVTWSTQQCGIGAGGPWGGWYGARGNCNCTCRSNGYFNYWDMDIIDHKTMPNYDDYVANMWRYWYPYNSPFRHSPIYKGLEFKVTKGGTTYTLN